MFWARSESVRHGPGRSQTVPKRFETGPDGPKLSAMVRFGPAVRAGDGSRPLPTVPSQPATWYIVLARQIHGSRSPSMNARDRLSDRSVCVDSPAVLSARIPRPANPAPKAPWRPRPSPRRRSWPGCRPWCADQGPARQGARLLLPQEHRRERHARLQDQRREGHRHLQLHDPDPLPPPTTRRSRAACRRSRRSTPTAGACAAGCTPSESALWRKLGWEWRFVGWNGHTTVEAKYDGRWHYLDVFLKFYAWMPDPNAPGGRTIAGEDDLTRTPRP